MERQKVGVEFGSEEMVLWRDEVDAARQGVEALERALRIKRVILECFEERFREAEAAFKDDS